MFAKFISDENEVREVMAMRSALDECHLVGGIQKSLNKFVGIIQQAAAGSPRACEILESVASVFPPRVPNDRYPD